MTLYENGVRRSGIYDIDPDGQGSFPVYCDENDFSTNGGGWMVFQRRVNGSVDFNRYI